MLNPFADYHFIFDIISGVAVVAGSYFGLMIKNALGAIRLEQANAKSELLLQQSHTKAELLAHQNEVKEEMLEQHDVVVEGQHDLRAEFVDRHAENKQSLAVHLNDDDRRFEALNTVLARIDKTVEKIANGH
jgi:hypothetical protein